MWFAIGAWRVRDPDLPADKLNLLYFFQDVKQIRGRFNLNAGKNTWNLHDMLVPVTQEILKMAQISVTIPSDLDEILNFLSAEHRRSKSDLASHALEIGLTHYLESLNKREVYLSLVEKRRARESAASQTE